MQRLRIILLVAVGCGIVMLLVELYSPTPDIVPFPGDAEYVRLQLKSPTGGTYYLEAAVPTVGELNSLPQEAPLPCAVSVSLRSKNVIAYEQRIGTIQRTGSIRYAHLDTYRVGDEFELRSGTYDVVITSLGACPAISQRGGAIMLARDVGDPTSDYLRRGLLHVLALTLSAGALLVLVALQFVRRPNPSLERP